MAMTPDLWALVASLGLAMAQLAHSLGAVEAKRRIASGVAAGKTQYGSYFRTSEAEWDGNRLTFCLTALAQTVRGTVKMLDQAHDGARHGLVAGHSGWRLEVGDNQPLMDF